MDLGSKISLEVLVGIASGLVGSIGAYIKLKTKIDRVEMVNFTQERELSDLKERKKELGTLLHKRIDTLKNDFTELQKDMTTGHQSLETKMAQMELRIVKEIQKLAK